MITKRSKDLRRKIENILHCDARLKKPIPKKNRLYHLIISLYCIDSTTSSKKAWRNGMKHMLSLLSSDGTLITAALRKCKFYTVNGYKFPSANIDENDLTSCLLNNGFLAQNIKIKVVSVKQKNHGFVSLMFACAKK